MHCRRSATPWPPLSSRRRLFLVLLLLAGTPLSARDPGIPPTTFQRLSLEEGLSQSIVEAITQDTRGLMWFCTEDGANSFDGYRFSVLKSDPGAPNSLSYNHTTAIAVDGQGCMWIGTFNGGLNRYDPRTDRTRIFRHDPGDTASLSNDIIRTLYLDRDGRLWIGTDAGLNRLDPASVSGDSATAVPFARFRIAPDSANPLGTDPVYAVAEDARGTLWVGTATGVATADPGDSLNRPLKFHHLRAAPSDPEGLSNGLIRTIYRDRREALWIGTADGLNRLVPDERGEGRAPRFERFAFDDSGEGLPHPDVWALFEDSRGTFWVGTNGGGLAVLDRDRREWRRFRHDPRDPTTLSYDEIRSIFEDRSGNLWVGTYGGGVSKVNRARKAFRHYRHDPDDPRGLNAAIVWSICEDRRQNLWVGTHGGGLNRFDPSRRQVGHFRADPDNPDSLSHDQVRLVIEDRYGLLWLATNGGLNRFDPAERRFVRYLPDPDDPNSVSHLESRALLEGRDGTIWLGTRGGGLDCISAGPTLDAPVRIRHYRSQPDDPGGLSTNFIRTLYEDERQRLWIGTLGGGLNQLDLASGAIRVYRADPGTPGRLSSDFVFTIYEDSSGTLWLGTWGGGLNRFDPVTERFTALTTDDGLPSDAIYGILPDARGRLWMSTDYGLSRFDPDSGAFRNFHVEDGLQSNEFNGGSFFRSPSGELFFGGINGFNAFFPDRIVDNRYVPPVVLTELRTFHKRAALPAPLWTLDELRLSWRDYIITLEFAALDFTNPLRNRYAYRLEGLDSDWVVADPGQRTATFTTLDPGVYTFHVKGSNNDGIWNEAGTRLRIVITPPFWETTGFRAVIAAALLGLVWVLFRIRMRTVRMKAELRAAHDAQMAIMPQADPELPGYTVSGACIPANEVGGDFYDYLWLDAEQTRFGIAVADVSGKAMKSAMSAVMTDGMICLEADGTAAIPDIMSRVNRSMHRKLDRAMFSALCLSGIDLKERRLRFTNAGLSEPRLKRNGTVRALRGTGPRYPLGSVRDTVYAETLVELEPGDVLVFYTDGLSEARNRRGHFMGDDDLERVLREMDSDGLDAAAVKKRILAAVERFTEGAPRHDDMTVVVVTVRG